jgi:hypothetical protein
MIRRTADEAAAGELSLPAGHATHDDPTYTSRVVIGVSLGNSLRAVAVPLPVSISNPVAGDAPGLRQECCAK